MQTPQSSALLRIYANKYKSVISNLDKSDLTSVKQLIYIHITIGQKQLSVYLEDIISLKLKIKSKDIIIEVQKGLVHYFEKTLQLQKDMVPRIIYHLYQQDDFEGLKQIRKQLHLEIIKMSQQFKPKNESYQQLHQTHSPLNKKSTSFEAQNKNQKSQISYLSSICVNQQSKISQNDINVHEINKNRIQDYLKTVNCKTQANLFCQKSKIPVPQYSRITKGINHFECSCKITIPQDKRKIYSKSIYIQYSQGTNTKSTQTDAAKNVLLQLFTNNIQLWQDFIKIKKKQGL